MLAILWEGREGATHYRKTRTWTTQMGEGARKGGDAGKDDKDAGKNKGEQAEQKIWKEVFAAARPNANGFTMEEECTVERYTAVRSGMEEVYRQREANYYELHGTCQRQKNWENIRKARGKEMAEDRDSELDDYIDSEEDVPVVEDEIHPKGMMDSSNLDKVKPREGTTRAVATLHAKDSSMGLPDNVEVVDEDEENKIGKERRTHHEQRADGKVTTSGKTRSKGTEADVTTQKLQGG